MGGYKAALRLIFDRIPLGWDRIERFMSVLICVGRKSFDDFSYVLSGTINGLKSTLEQQTGKPFQLRIVKRRTVGSRKLEMGVVGNDLNSRIRIWTLRTVLY